MRFSVSLSLLRVISGLFLATAVGAIGLGAWLVVDDARESTDLYDGLGAGIGWLLVGGGVPVLALAGVAALSTRRVPAAASGLVLALVPVGVLVTSGGDYAPWPALVAALGVALGVCAVRVLADEGVRAAERAST